MSGRIYDEGKNPFCKLCGSDAWTSKETNFNGPQCKNKNCKSTWLDIKYKHSWLDDNDDLKIIIKKL